MTAPYYVENDIPLRFAVLEKGKPIYPTEVFVTVFNPIGGVVVDSKANVKNNEVNYIVPASVVTDDGEYTIVFKVRVAFLGIRTHTMKVDVLPLPVGDESKDDDETLELEPKDQNPQIDSWDKVPNNWQYRKVA